MKISHISLIYVHKHVCLSIRQGAEGMLSIKIRMSSNPHFIFAVFLQPVQQRIHPTNDEIGMDVKYLRFTKTLQRVSSIKKCNFWK